MAHQTVTKVQFLVMVSLLRFPMHPYAIRQEIISLTGHRYFPSKSTVHSAINRLEHTGFVSAGDAHDDPYIWLKSRQSVPYKLTPLGHHRLKQEAKMYGKLLQWVEQHTHTS